MKYCPQCGSDKVTNLGNNPDEDEDCTGYIIAKAYEWESPDYEEDCHLLECNDCEKLTWIGVEV